MDAVVESLLTTINILEKKRSLIHESSRDLIRLCQRCEVFKNVLSELKNHPMMLNDLTESENELLYDLHTTIQNLCTFIDDNVNPSDLKAITQLEFRLSYFTDLAQLNQKIIQLIEALNLIEDVDLDRLRDEDLEDAKESFEFIVQKVTQEISRPNNVYFEEEFDSLSQDIDSHEEALSKLLALLKHRSLSVNEVKILKAEIAKLKASVEERRLEMRRTSQPARPSDFFPTRAGDSSMSKTNSKISSPARSSGLLANGANSTNYTGISIITPQTGSVIPFAQQLQNQQAPNHSSSSAISSSSTYHNCELTASLLNRLLKVSDTLAPEESALKKRLLDAMALQPKDIEATKTRVGRGVFGDVCLGTLRNRYKIAIKTLKRSNDARKDEQRKRLIEKEMLITKYLGTYPTIPLCYGFVTNEASIQIILELAPYGSLSLILNDNQSFPIIPAGLKIAWLSDLADAIRFLHSKEIMHKSVCADNLLVFEKLRIKLSDFGPEKQQNKSRTDGDVKAFVAPEVREGKNPEYGSDIYSFGMTSIQIFSRRLPHMERPQEQIIAAIDKEWIDPPESKNTLIKILSDTVKYDLNEHVNTTRPNSESLFQEVLCVLETVGGDPREETRSHDFYVIQELESTARQKRNEMLRSKSNYKSNLALRNSSSYNSMRRSGNFNSSSWLLRSSFNKKSSSNNNLNNASGNVTGFSYSHLNMVPENGNDLPCQSIDIEDKASIAYFLIQAAKFTPLEADFMADRLVRKGVSCVSTLRRKLHRDSNYLSTIGIDKEIAKRIQSAIFSMKSTTGEKQQQQANYSSSSSANLSSPRNSSRPRNHHRDSTGSASSSNKTFYGDNEGHTDRDNETDSLESADHHHNIGSSSSPSKKKETMRPPMTKESIMEKAFTAADLDPDVVEEKINVTTHSTHSNVDASAKKLYSNTKNLIEKRNILSKFMRVEINLSPDLANKYSDILISRGVYDLNLLHKKMLDDSKILIKYGFDRRIANQIFDHVSAQVINRFNEESFRNSDLDMSINANTIVNNAVALNTPGMGSSNNLKDYVNDNCLSDTNPLDIANLYYEASQLSNTDSLEKLLEIAENGDYIAQGFLMRMYALGQGDVQQDIIVAKEMGTKLFPWLQHAIQSDNSSHLVMIARYLTGVCYSIGLGVQQNEGEAIKWYLQSAHQGYIGAQAYLGYCYYLGVGVERNLKEAFNWYKISALRGHSASQCNLGLCYEFGHGVDKNIPEAVRWYRLSAEQGDVIAQFSLGNIYEKGKKPAVEQNLKEAFRFYKLSAERGYDQAQYAVGCCYYAGLGTDQSLEESFRWFLKSSTSGNPAAHCKVGFCYENGIGTEKNIGKAIDSYRFASEQGNAAAMYYLGYCYFTGMGVETNVEEAVRLYTLSAEKKYAAAQNNLGFCYFNGVGVQKDLKAAFKWYNLAAAQEYPAAQYNLGYCYEKGLGVQVDLPQSFHWYQSAAKNGHSRARKALKKFNDV